MITKYLIHLNHTLLLNLPIVDALLLPKSYNFNNISRDFDLKVFDFKLLTKISKTKYFESGKYIFRRLNE